MMKPDRIVIGVDCDRARDLMSEIYATFVRTGNPILFMDVHSSELTKYASNAMLATRISFMNEIAAICDRVGADVDQVRRGMGADPRIGSKFLFAGVGYGGSCFPKDVKALVATGHGLGVPMNLLAAVEEVNAAQKRLLLARVAEVFGADLAGLRFAVWGLAFKPNTDDMREAPSLDVVRGLCAAGATVAAYDPVAGATARAELSGVAGVTFVADAYEAVRDADALLLVTEWGEFRQPDFDRIKALMRRPVILDGRNILAPQRLKELGFSYRGVGRS
jgi:UDPglucose 6-dehydrogenase